MREICKKQVMPSPLRKRHFPRKATASRKYGNYGKSLNLLCINQLAFCHARPQFLVVVFTAQRLTIYVVKTNRLQRQGTTIAPQSTPLCTVKASQCQFLFARSRSKTKLPHSGMPISRCKGSLLFVMNYDNWRGAA